MPTGPVVRRRFGAAFLLPLAALGWVGGGEDTTGGHLFVVAVVCGIAGAAWQLLHRRDLVDRLTHFASAFTVVAVFVFAIAAWGSPTTSFRGAGVGLGGILTGLVYAEQWLRSRDRRRARLQIRAAQARRRTSV